IEDPLDLRLERGIAHDARRRSFGAATPRIVLIIGRRGDFERSADRLDPIFIAVLVDEGDHHFGRRSSSARAKYADAFFRISLACLSSRFSRSSAFIRSRSSLVSPARTPASRSACATQLCSVCAAQPILGAMASIAAHCEGCSLVCSSTMRTARSRTSGEKFGLVLVFLIGAPSHEREPPAKPVRFSIERGRVLALA